MKNAKDRVIALDYFRGVAILIVLVNHSAQFSMPLAYLTGNEKLWVSAAELFFLISGITFGIVRSGKILKDFKSVLKKTYKRAVNLYLVAVALSLASLWFARVLNDHRIADPIPGSFPAGSLTHVFYRVITLDFAYGWATALIYFSVFLVIAPFLLYALWTKWWPAVPVLSALIFVLNSFGAISISALQGFALWQFYYVLGLTLARFRVPLISTFYSLPHLIKLGSARIIMWSALTLLAISALFEYALFPHVNRLTEAGWLPVKAQNAYAELLNHKLFVDSLFENNKLGVLRPVVLTFVFLSMYLIYQNNKTKLLKYSGRFVTTMGKETFPIYISQAILIPLIIVIPIARNLFFNLLLTSLLIISMWAVARRRIYYYRLRAYVVTLRESYKSSKETYILRQYGEQE